MPFLDVRRREFLDPALLHAGPEGGSASAKNDRARLCQQIEEPGEDFLAR
jgi:hypothetical protein